ncbi:glycosyltransferase family 39 protein [Xanthomonas euvesicatoria]|uniref:Glycosyltransferase family 39 protein n=1 Tax=Xanthomonas euvesicatoria TaxID=456327 RepID=A0A6B3KLD6_XANEU|nr:glycosyltransferase family 39 protein [Xanthomonas euvesicatoria]KLB47336.1 membrane protein [Xanthomonas euvesicatoria]KLB65153.1 membrane protein [Xanthomonas euvesicatoria]MDC9661572.1 glycosyltransferase family 39 protein [Xanthomonas euvesicatoria]NEK73699.1 glycosyltransferase family 39 protein [Xanthomonas euvesicatoria]NEL30478.1 glycosyltransferase family 39 protein [Xanthomonas euvesicatoria]
MRVSPAIAASSSRQRALLAALLTIVVSLLAGLGMRQPNPPDEPRFVLAARTMVETGQWLLPHRGSELYAEKPPAFMWLQAATYELVPHWPVAFLLPSLLAALATLWLTWDIARRLWTRRVAAHAVLALFTVLQFGLMAKRAQIDMVLVALTTLSLWGLLRHLLRGPDWRAWTLGLFAAGVGTVTKGVGFLPLLVLLPWMALRRTHWRVLPARALAGRSWALVLPAFVAGTAVWLGPLGIALWHSDDPQLHAYAHELLFKQTGTRYAHAWHHVKPFWYYLQVIATLWLPGCLLLPWLLPAWWRRLRRGDPRYVLLLAWSVLVLLFFSASPGKREVYIFPMLPALCIAAAPLLAGLLRRRGVRALLTGYVLLLAVAGLALGGGIALHLHWAENTAVKRGMELASLQPVGFWLIGLGVVGLAASAWSRGKRAGTALVVMTAALWTVFGLGLMPALDPYSSSSRLMQRVGQRIGPDAQLGMLAWREQNLLQADRPVTDFGFKASWQDQWAKAGPWLAQAPHTRWLFVLKQAVPACIDPAQRIDIGESNRNQWQLLPGTAWHAGCIAAASDAEQTGGEGDAD